MKSARPNVVITQPEVANEYAQEQEMKKLSIAIAATIVASTPSFAAAPDWWLVSGGPGAPSVQFVDAASIKKIGGAVSFDVATYWGNGRNMERALTISCNEQPGGSPYADLQKFACGSDETRMNTALKLGSMDLDWMAKTVLAMPS